MLTNARTPLDCQYWRGATRTPKKERNQTMRKNISKVIEAFIIEASAKGDSAGTCSTDGQIVYSYNMPIARRTVGFIEVVHYVEGPSRTTKSQIRALEITFPNAVRVDNIDTPF